MNRRYSLTALCLTGLTGWLAVAADPRPGTYEAMDYGSVIGQTVAADWPKGNVAFKGLAVRLADELAVIFDTDLLRYAVGTEGGWIDLSETDRTSYKGAGIGRTEGREVFATAPLPGWAANGSFADPREGRRGNLPPSHARYGGYYRHGSDVVLSYTVGGTAVHELPGGVRMSEGAVAFVRTFSVGPAETPHAIYLLEGRPESAVRKDGAEVVRVEEDERVLLVRLLDAPPGAGLRVRGGTRVTLELAGSIERRVFRVVVAEFPKGRIEGRAAEMARVLAAKLPRDPLGLVGGGPVQWNGELETAVKLGVESAGGYVRDEIRIPFENPWGSWMRPAGIAFFPAGERAAFSTWNGDVWIVSGLGETTGTVRWKRFASGLFFPMGLAIVDDVIHVVERGQVTRLHDLNGNGEADYFENFNNEGVLQPRAHALCLEVDSEGNFYFFKNGNRVPSSVPEHGALIRLSPDGKQREVFATGIRGANTLAIGPGDTILGADQQGDWVPVERVDRYRRGGFYGFRQHGGADIPLGEFEPPVMWMPYTINNSSGSLSHAGDPRWGPLAGTWVLGSYGQGTLFVLLMEEIDGLWQGGAVGFPFRLSSGPVRSAFSPADGQLYVLGMRGWGTRMQGDGSFDRIRYAGGPVYLPVELNVETEGVRLRFAEALDPAAADVSRYEVKRWQYLYSSRYGSAEYSVADPGKQERDPMAVEAVELSDDHRNVFLRLADMRPVMQMMVAYDVLFKDGHREENAVYHTVHRLGDGRHTVAPVLVARDVEGERRLEVVAAGEDGLEIELTSLHVRGRDLHRANCQSCHQSSGTGGVAPPLEKSEWVGGDPAPLIRIVLQGKESDTGVMMPFGWMADEEISAVLSYLREYYHEESPIAAGEVAGVRRETSGRDTFWTSGELNELRAGQ